MSRAAASRTLLACAVALGSIACGAAPPLAQRGPAVSRWSYVFAVDERLTRLDAAVCFEGAPPYALAPVDPSGRR